MHKAEKSKLEKSTNFQDFEKKFNQLLDSIENIHNNSIIHRDLKPENIFEYDGRLVLADFDISKFEDINHINLVNTCENDRLANFHYSAPEQSNKDF